MSITNNMMFKKFILGGAVFMSTFLLSACGGGGGSNGAGSVSESERISSALSTRQTELSTDSIEGLWLAYTEESYSYSEIEEGYSFEESGNYNSKIFVEANSLESGEVVLTKCSGARFATIDSDIANIDFSASDDHDRPLAVNNNLKMSFSYRNVYEDASESSTETEIESGNVWLYKVSDVANSDIGEFVLGEHEGFVECLQISSITASFTEVSGRGSHSGNASQERYRVWGDKDFTLTRFEGDVGEGGGGSFISFDGNSYSNGASFNVTEISPLEYQLSVILDETTPEMVGDVLIHDVVTGK